MDIVLYSLRKVVEDLNQLELISLDISTKISVSEYNRLRQFSENNKKRLQRALWEICGQELSEEERSQ